MAHTFTLRFLLSCAATFGLSGLMHVAVAASQPDVQSKTLDKIRASNTLTLGYRESSIPFSYLGTDQQPVGFSLDLCRSIADAVKAKLNLPTLHVAYQAVTAANRIPLLQNGTVDIECGSTTSTAERKQQVDFTVATFAGAPTWMTKNGSGIQGESDLKGKTVVVTQGSLNLGLAKELNEKRHLGITIVQASEQSQSFLMLNNGRAAAWFEDNILEAGLAAGSADPTAFRYLPNSDGQVYYYGLMLPKGDAAFKALVDDVLKAQMASGQFAAAYDKWFMHPIPPKQQNLALPMSAALKARIDAPSDAL